QSIALVTQATLTRPSAKRIVEPQSIAVEALREGWTLMRVGWIGIGRMGSELAGRLAAGGCDLAVYNRTRAKAEPLATLGATVVDSIGDLAYRDVVFSCVSASADLEEVVLGPAGLLAAAGGPPGLLIDMSTVSAETSATVRV